METNGSSSNSESVNENSNGSLFNSIYVPVDNSEHSNRAIELAAILGKKFDSQVSGSHVYAASMHDYRFKQMEFTLPEEYLQEQEIERQRKIHDSLITMGLELISDCYLNPLDEQCKAKGVEKPIQRKMMDGKHYIELVKDIEESDYDLTIIGALGVGKTRYSQIGTVCERVTRKTTKDVLVVKHLPKEREPERDTILVCIDGSPDSFGGLMTAIELSKKFNKKLELIGVYDPYLHYVVFNSVVDVLTEKAAKVFRFEEQNQLHEEVIDTGLAQIYQSHLNVGELIAKDHGVEAKKTLLDGKAFQKILQRIEEDPPWLVVVGKVGVHKIQNDDDGLGSTSENILRQAPCDILFNTRQEYPALDRRADESILWTTEAETKMERVPQAVKGIARTAILRLAIEQGHSVVTESVIEEAMDRFMPKETAEATRKLAEAIALEKVEQGKVSQCGKCGVVSRNVDPVQCSVCGGKEFHAITKETVEQIAEAQGGVVEEEGYDGRKLAWSQDARKLLLSIEDKYQKRRAKARIEKSARVKKLDVISFEFARQIIVDEIGPELPFEIPAAALSNSEKQNAKPEVDAFENVTPLSSYTSEEEDFSTVVKDEKGEELRSVYHWTPEAIERIFKIPAGFMRNKTQQRAEKLAMNSKSLVIDLDILNGGIDVGRKVMEEVVPAEVLTEALTKAEESADPNEPKGKCPFSALFAEGSGKERADAFEKVLEFYEDEENLVKMGKANSKGDTDHEEEKRKNGGKPVSHVHTGAVPDLLNQAGLMREMEKRRREFKED